MVVSAVSMSMSMSMWSLRWHFTNKSVTRARYSIRGYSLSHSWTLRWRVRWLKHAVPSWGRDGTAVITVHRVLSLLSAWDTYIAAKNVAVEHCHWWMPIGDTGASVVNWMRLTRRFRHSPRAVPTHLRYVFICWRACHSETTEVTRWQMAVKLRTKNRDF